MKLTRPLIILDLETTGVWVEKDKIIEVGMIRVLPDADRVIYHKRVNPGIPIPPSVTQLTGIRDEDVQEARSFKFLYKEILDFMGDADLAGFNLERFDLPLLEREIFDAGGRFEWRKRRIFDAQRIYHAKERRDLKAAYKFYCQKDLLNAHTALGDAEATWEILLAQTRAYGQKDENIDSLLPLCQEPPSEFFDSERKFRFWNGALYPVFGKYGRKLSLEEIARRDRSYLSYLSEQDFDEKTRTMLKACLEGRFPTPR